MDTVEHETRLTNSHQSEVSAWKSPQFPAIRDREMRKKKKKKKPHKLTMQNECSIRYMAYVM